MTIMFLERKDNKVFYILWMWILLHHVILVKASLVLAESYSAVGFIHKVPFRSPYGVFVDRYVSTSQTTDYLISSKECG